MSDISLWSSPLYRETVIVVLAFIFIIALGLFFLRNKNAHFTAAWASVKSWLITAPIILMVFGFPKPWPLVFLVMVSIYASKLFFQMTGMYHRSWYVWTCYVAQIVMGYLIYTKNDLLYNLMPMIFLGTLALIPLIRNSAKKMIQYIALTLMAFIFFGWSFLHLGWLLHLEKGIYVILYLYIISELTENASMAGHRVFGKHKFFTKISNRLSLEGSLFAIFVAFLSAWGLRHLLPIRTEPYWIAVALIASFAGRFGALFISIIRKDLGLKDTGVFILGRGDIIDRLDKLIFIGPIFYYVYLYLKDTV
ncbi:phosphatidate cytidylyltransferase [bacterium]|nr:phosphatidate cytidylyltransferase [bacterium]